MKANEIPRSKQRPRPVLRLHAVLNEVPNLYSTVIAKRWPNVDNTQELQDALDSYTSLEPEIFLGETHLQRLLAHRNHLDDMLTRASELIKHTNSVAIHGSIHFSQWNGPLGKPPIEPTPTPGRNLKPQI